MERAHSSNQRANPHHRDIIHRDELDGAVYATDQLKHNKEDMILTTGANQQPPSKQGFVASERKLHSQRRRSGSHRPSLDHPQEISFPTQHTADLDGDTPITPLGNVWLPSQGADLLGQEMTPVTENFSSTTGRPPESSNSTSTAQAYQPHHLSAAKGELMKGNSKSQIESATMEEQTMSDHERKG
jgi:hypothetical protein